MRRRLASLPLLLLPLSACSPSAPQAREPLTVQVARIGEDQFSPGIQVVSQLSSTTDVALRPEIDGRVVKILVQ